MGNETKTSPQHITETAQCHFAKPGRSMQSRLFLKLALVCLPWNVVPNSAAHGSRRGCQKKHKNHLKGEKNILRVRISIQRGPECAFLKKVQLTLTPEGAVTMQQAQVVCMRIKRDKVSSGKLSFSCLQHLEKKSTKLMGSITGY